MKITRIPLEKLNRPKKNVRIHGDKQIKEFIRSITMFGQIRPIVVDENFTMLCGNGLYEALLQMGKTEADCYIAVGLSEIEKKKLMLTDNRIFSLGSDNLEAFDEILSELDKDYDIPGYEEDLIRTLTASTSDIDNLIKSYGTFDDQSRQAMQRNAEIPVQESDHIAPATPPEPRNDTFQPIQQEPIMEHNLPAERVETSIPTQPTRYVLCPNCGERIPV